jgi:CheY-like chemotaxis protein
MARSRIAGDRAKARATPSKIFGTFAVAMSCSQVSEGQTALGNRRHAALVESAFLMALILIVEDDPFIIQNAKWMIADLGHETLLADDLASALLHLSASTHIDALFVDIRLAGLALGGYDVANRAVGIRPDLKVLYTSGSAITADMSDRFVGGGLFLQKPYSPEQLEVSVGELLYA